MVDEGPALLEFGLILAHHVRSHPICREGSPSEVGGGVGFIHQYKFGGNTVQPITSKCLAPSLGLAFHGPLGEDLRIYVVPGTVPDMEVTCEQNQPLDHRIFFFFFSPSKV